MASKAKKANLRIVPPLTDDGTDSPRVTLPPEARDYYQRIETYAKRIRNTHDVAEIIGILDEAMRETRGLSGHTDLQVANERITRAEGQIAALKAELQEAVTLVQVDQLTQVLNRRGLEESFSREAARSDRHGAPLCVAIIDLDNFKSVNDTWGHATGDAALTHLAATLRQTLRPVDVVARFGGEEFVVLLPESGEGAAKAALSRVQRALTDKRNHRKVPPLTFSAGIALRSRGEELADVIERADGALLDAKRAGKDRIFLVENETTAA